MQGRARPADRKDRTTLVIAHRLSTVQHADRIVVLDDGRIVEVGPHAELIEHGGIYSRLYEIRSSSGRKRPAPPPTTKPRARRR